MQQPHPQQLTFDLGLPALFHHQLIYLGWTAVFKEESGEVVYSLTTPDGRLNSTSYTNLPPTKMAEAIAQAKQAIVNLEATPPFVMSPQPSPKPGRGASQVKSEGDNQQRSTSRSSINLKKDPISVPQACINVNKPFLKWLGSKRWAIERLQEIYKNHKHRRLVDLTLGSGAIPLALQPDRVLACDINPWLIALWQWIQQGEKFTIDLRSDEQYFYECRDRYNDLVVSNPKHPDIPQLLYLLCRTSYNGLHRSSSKKAFNAPWGKYKKFGGLTDLSSYRSVIKHWEFIACDFREVVFKLQDDDFLIFDPPYDSNDGKAFVSYAGQFDQSDQIEAAELLSQLELPVIAFNADTLFIRSLYQDFGFDIESVDVARRVSCKGDRSKAKELILTKNLG